MSSKRVPKDSKAIRFICGPVRAVARAWDLYLKSMAGLSWPAAYGNTMGCPIPNFSSVAPNHSTVDEELKNVVRLATARHLIGDSTAVGHYPKKRVVPLGGGGAAVPISFERIDEDPEF